MLFATEAFIEVWSLIGEELGRAIQSCTDAGQVIQFSRVIRPS